MCEADGGNSEGGHCKAEMTLKVVGLEGDPEIPELVCTSLYDSKPF